MPEINIKLFGAIEINRNGEPITNFRSQKVLALLAYLICEDRPVTRDYVAGLLWPASTQKQALGLLRRSLHNLTSQLPGLLEIDRRVVAFKPTESITIDTQRFAELATRTDVTDLAEAAGLYRAPFLEGVYLKDCPVFEQWLIIEQQRWRNQAGDLLDRLIRVYCDQGNYDVALTYANRRLALTPWQEAAHRLTMRLLAYQGQYNAALAQYQSCHHILNEELGVDPSPETTQLYSRIWMAQATPRHNLPPQPTSFIGRQKEIDHLCKMLSQAECRLLSIIGPGGMGKTRLALRVAETQTDHFLNGVTFVRLASVSTLNDLLGTLSDILQLPPSQGIDSQTQLLSYLQAQERLLVLDNFEHLLQPDEQSEQSVLRFLLEILNQAVDVKLLVTSREPLKIRWEQIFELHGLSYPSQGDTSPLEAYDSIQLYLDHLGRRQRQAARPEPDWSCLVQICQLTEGIPLAIELAAGLAQIQACASIATAIEANIKVLSTTMQDVPSRHRSLEATFEYSWQLLADNEQAVFRRLSVFQSGFERNAAKQVAQASSPILSRLVDKSLLRLAADGRYDLHEFLRQFGAAKLAQRPKEQAIIQERHGLYYATLMENQGQHLKGSPAQAQALATVNQELANVRASWQWAIDNRELASLSQAVEGLGHFYEIHSRYQEGLELFGQAASQFEQVVHLPDIDHSLAKLVWGRVLAWQGVYAHRLGLLDQCRMVSKRSIDILSTLGLAFKKETLLARFNLGIADGLYAGNLDKAQQIFTETQRISEETNALWELASALELLGIVALDRGLYSEARRYFTRTLAIAQEMNDQWGLGICLGNLSEVFYHLGDFVEAKQFAQEAYTVSSAIDHQSSVLYALNSLGNAHFGLGDYAGARAHFKHALEIGLQLGVLTSILDILPNFATLLLMSDGPEQAITVLTFCLNHPASPDQAKGKAQTLLTQFEAQCSPEIFAHAQVRGQTRELSAVVAEIFAGDE